MEEPRPQKFRSLASKFSIFTGVLVLWIVVTILCWDLGRHNFELTKGVVLLLIVGVVAAAISRFTGTLLARPIGLLQEGITAVRKGRLEPIQVSRTGDEIEYLGESFNRMIEALAASKEEIRQHQELLEDRIRQRTDDLETAMHSALAASQAKSEFLANMSHELRTPMNGLLGMLDLVLDHGVSGEQKEQLETAQRCAYALLALLNDILDLSKIEAGKMMLERIPFNVRTVIEDCVKSQAPKAAQKRVDLRFETDAVADVQVLGDPLRVRQITVNLLSNAIKFTEQGSVWVRLGTSTAADGRVNVRIEVRDTGPGISPEKLPVMFEKFTQADGSISRKYGGTGLGLAITRKLVDLHGGEIRVESELRKGSAFIVTLPCDRAPVPVADGPSKRTEAAEPAAESPARLLVVEDNLVNQKVVLAILRRKGYFIDVANDGREALTRLRAGSYDLVLMDVQMPVLDGLEATRAIRREAQWDRLPIVAMTAHAMNGDRERCLQAGMNGYISKPVQPAHLVAMIEKHLKSVPVQNAKPVTALEQSITDRLMREDSALVNGMLQLFLQLAPERLERLDAAARRADSIALTEELAKISAAADQLAASPVKECAERIDRAATAGNFEQVRIDLETLRAEIRALESASAQPITAAPLH